MRSAFTLIELLVVITVIVVLLALLSPALDKAVYQAEMAVCGANLHTLGNSVAAYAAGNSRRYPARDAIVVNSASRPSLLYGGNLRVPQFDDRRLFRTFMNINDALQCPLSLDVDLETRDPASWVYGDRSLWFGWRFRTGNRPQRGMFKVGDRLQWNTDSFSILASDMVVINHERGGAHGEHPDYRDGKMTAAALQDADGVEGAGFAGKNTVAIWWGPKDRGPIDKNILYEDLSLSLIHI